MMQEDGEGSEVKVKELRNNGENDTHTSCKLRSSESRYRRFGMDTSEDFLCHLKSFRPTYRWIVTTYDEDDHY